ncbi:MAG: hypothetical protein ACLFVR_06595 [Thiohalospira sp.]
MFERQVLKYPLEKDTVQQAFLPVVKKQISIKLQDYQGQHTCSKDKFKNTRWKKIQYNRHSCLL